MGDGTYAVLDTNALLLPFTDGTNLEDELLRLLGAVRMVVPSSIVQELQGLAGGDSKAARAAKAALRYLDRCRVEPTGLPGDDGVLDVARRLGGAVVSNDRNLRGEAKRSGLTVVAPRGKGRLSVE